MSRHVKRRLSPTGPQTVIADELETFAKNLHYALIEKNMNQSDLARIVFDGQTRVDNRGYETVVGRDAISRYLRGKNMPDPRTLQRIADALDKSVEELAPSAAASAIERENPEVEIKVIPGHHETALLRINKLVPLTLAAEIATMIANFEKSKK